MNHEHTTAYCSEDITCATVMSMKKPGYLEVIAGPMYCGKTEELIRQVKRATIGKKKVQVFKHSLDLRYGADKKLYSHAGMTFDSELVAEARDILPHVRQDTEIVGIDEAQFFKEDLIPVIQTLLVRGHHVVIAGLAMTFDGQPFRPVPELMSLADKVTKLSAVCSRCGEDAVYHKRVGGGTAKDAFIIDASQVKTIKEHIYEARCRNCFRKK